MTRDPAREALALALHTLRTTAVALAEKGYVAWAATTLDLANKIERIGGNPLPAPPESVGQ